MARCNGWNEVDEEMLEAAAILISMKYQKITKIEGNMLRKKIVKHRNHNHRRREHYDHIAALLEDFPVVSCLRGMVKECSGVAVEKQLTCSDVLESQNRLNLTKKVVEDSFLPMLENDEDVIKGIPVTGYDIDGNVYSLTFKFWANKLYVLNGEWKKFFKYHRLRMVEDCVKVWMFRHAITGKICFLINHTRLPETIAGSSLR